MLRAVVLDPDADVELRATVILSHAMLARRSAFGQSDRPGLSSILAARGFRTVAFDFRGHGDSVQAPEERQAGWGYDDLVRLDLPAVVECARARAEGKAVIVVGHSLGGHVALAAQGTQRIAADAIVAIAANVWLRAFEASQLRWAAKIAIARAMLAVSESVDRSSRVGPAPPVDTVGASLVARLFQGRMRLDRDDAPVPYVRDLFRGVTEDTWTSRDGRDDYLGALSLVKVPVAAVLGDRDRVLCHPVAGEAFARRCAGPVALFRAPVGHMELVTNERGWPAVLDAIDWAAGARGA